MIHRFLAQTFHEAVTFIKNVTLKANLTIAGIITAVTASITGNLTVDGDVNIGGVLTVDGNTPDTTGIKRYSVLLTISEAQITGETVLYNDTGLIPVVSYASTGTIDISVTGLIPSNMAMTSFEFREVGFSGINIALSGDGFSVQLISGGVPADPIEPFIVSIEIYPA